MSKSWSEWQKKENRRYDENGFTAAADRMVRLLQQLGRHGTPTPETRKKLDGLIVELSAFRSKHKHKDDPPLTSYIRGDTVYAKES